MPSERSPEAEEARGGDPSVQSEVDQIVALALSREARIVTLGALVLFSTETGDAWMLDPDDGLALCLARAGKPRTVRISESDERFLIEWHGSYRIDSRFFSFVDESGRAQSIAGYPLRAILQASRSPR